MFNKMLQSELQKVIFLTIVGIISSYYVNAVTVNWFQTGLNFA